MQFLHRKEVEDLALVVFVAIERCNAMEASRAEGALLPMLYVPTRKCSMRRNKSYREPFRD
jgi:hypothetical protein